MDPDTEEGLQDPTRRIKVGGVGYFGRKTLEEFLKFADESPMVYMDPPRGYRPAVYAYPWYKGFFMLPRITFELIPEDENATMLRCKEMLVYFTFVDQASESGWTQMYSVTQRLVYNVKMQKAQEKKSDPNLVFPPLGIIKDTILGFFWDYRPRVELSDDAYKYQWKSGAEKAKAQKRVISINLKGHPDSDASEYGPLGRIPTLLTEGLFKSTLFSKEKIKKLDHRSFIPAPSSLPPGTKTQHMWRAVTSFPFTDASILKWTLPRVKRSRKEDEDDDDEGDLSNDDSDIQPPLQRLGSPFGDAQMESALAEAMGDVEAAFRLLTLGS